MNYFDLANGLNFKNYCSTINRFLRKDRKEQVKLAFSLYDWNEDRKICANDVF